MAQVLTNLLINAAQAMEPGGRLAIRARSEDGQLSLEVRDTGAGIPPEHRSRIFDPFFTTKPDGTGLGLSISYGIVQEHRGQIEVESRTREEVGPEGKKRISSLWPITSWPIFPLISVRKPLWRGAPSRDPSSPSGRWSSGYVLARGASDEAISKWKSLVVPARVERSEEMRHARQRRRYPRRYPRSIIWATFSLRGETKDYIGMVNDISPGGIGILSAARVAPGAVLEILLREGKEKTFFEEERLFGEVRWCNLVEWVMEIHNLGIQLIGCESAPPPLILPPGDVPSLPPP